jgi:hypothetical protein
VKEKFGHKLKGFNGLGKIGQIQGIKLVQEGRYEEALPLLSGYSSEKEIKPILIRCYYKVGQKRASKDNWSDAQQNFKKIIELGDKSRIIQSRLNILSELIREPPNLENYYTMGRERKTLRIPHIDKNAYFPQVDNVKCVGIYKWRGDQEASDYWSSLLRCIKRGNTGEAKEAGRIAAITLLQCISLETPIREEADLILPIPPDPERFKERKFNIPTLLAETVSQYSSIPMFDDILIKNFSTEKRAPSSVLSTALGIKKPEEVKGRNILIIDDITTHGHTFSTCGVKLKKAGANQVFAAALAHSEPTSSW